MQTKKRIFIPFSVIIAFFVLNIGVFQNSLLVADDTKKQEEIKTKMKLRQIRLSVNFRNASIGSVIRNIRSNTDLYIMMDSILASKTNESTRRVTIYGKRLSIKTILEKIVDTHPDVQWEIDGKNVRIFVSSKRRRPPVERKEEPERPVPAAKPVPKPQPKDSFEDKIKRIMVTMNMKNTDIKDAVAELSKASSVKIEIKPDACADKSKDIPRIVNMTFEGRPLNRALDSLVKQYKGLYWDIDDERIIIRMRKESNENKNKHAKLPPEERIEKTMITISVENEDIDIVISKLLKGCKISTLISNEARLGKDGKTRTVSLSVENTCVRDALEKVFAQHKDIVWKLNGNMLYIEAKTKE